MKVLAFIAVKCIEHFITIKTIILQNIYCHSKSIEWPFSNELNVLAF